MPPRTRPQIRVTAKDEGLLWTFCVKDNGIGIDPAHFRRIFEPFQAPASQGPLSWQRLGLAICEKIVSGFGGRIWVESEPGAGSSFLFTIPKKGGKP